MLRNCLSPVSKVPAAVCRPPRYWHDEHRRPLKHPRLQAAVPPAPLLARRTLSPTRVSAARAAPKTTSTQKSPESTPDHDSVAAAVSHKHHSIIRVGAGLLQFVHACTCTSFSEAISIKNLFRPFSPASFRGLAKRSRPISHHNAPVSTKPRDDSYVDPVPAQRGIRTSEDTANE